MSLPGASGLGNLTRKYLCVPGTIQAERVFSGMGWLLNKRRLILSGDYVSMLYFSKDDLVLWTLNTEHWRRRKGYNRRLIEYSHLVLVTRSAAKFEKVPSTSKYTPPTPSVIFCYMPFSAKKTLCIRKGWGAKLGVQRILLSLECFASLSQIDGESSMDGDWGQYGRLNIEAQSNFPLNGPLHIVHKDICILLLCKSHLSQICNTWVLREGCKKNTWELGSGSGLVTR